jgi:hypothetical protein
MQATSTLVLPQTSKNFPPIFWGGLVGGALDITAAIILLGLRGSSPIQVLQSVASGLLGMDAYQGGVPTAILGLFCHFVIAFSAATVFHFASIKLKILTQHAALCGLLYGVAVYLFMNFVVLPLSAFPHKINFTPAVIARGMSVIMFCVGLPISLINKHYSKAT